MNEYIRYDAVPVRSNELIFRITDIILYHHFTTQRAHS
jgi:hypothetical protein